MAAAAADNEAERAFNEWYNSIEFVNRRGVVVPATLTEDVSPDPEGDRTEED